MIEIRHCQSLIALAEAGNMTLAAKKVHLTQSALSHQLKTLEEDYGSALFERKSRPLRWTACGERLVALAYDLTRAVAGAERDLSRILEGKSGELRIAVECHSCFDWLMPAMDQFRKAWPEVEQDLVSGFHPDPVELLEENRADLVVVSRKQKRTGIDFHPLFSYDMPVLLACEHHLCGKDYVTAGDFARETLISYPIPDERLDLVRQVLRPAGVDPARRQSMLTVAILQLVASRRGVAALPGWAVQPYLEREYITARPIGKNGLSCRLWGATRREGSKRASMKDFLKTMREVSFRELRDIREFS